ncbi:MAG TPA: hypothetical protein VIU11_14390 [Nakamurella sp.]
MVWALAIILAGMVALELLTLFALGSKIEQLERVIHEHDDHLDALNTINAIQARHLDFIRSRLDHSSDTVESSGIGTSRHR